ncbi:adenylate/guanylate cyclase domain-containing protein [Actinomadura oligospora]|uniref:adenylate/guanylate cyclase domain-containing protein n=1 Tax=Actinomadura oligospora TaxID=111804 RepID=UPI0004B5AF0D|nr:adenylate/guanylate cyclase domain-containing protein [Actinomadura oligospora]
MTGRTVKRGLVARLDLIPIAPRTMLELRVRWVLLIVVGTANLGGALVVLLFATFVIPDPPIHDVEHVRFVNTVAFFSYPLVAGPVAMATGLFLWRPVIRLAREGGVPDAAQRRAVLLGPLRLTLLVGMLWTVGAIGWAALDAALFNARMATKVGSTCLLGAITTCTLVYLLSERLLRPAAALALESRSGRNAAESVVRNGATENLATGNVVAENLEAGDAAVENLAMGNVAAGNVVAESVAAARSAQDVRLPGVTTRVMLAWALGTAVPVFGLVCVGVAALVTPGIRTTQLALTILALGATALGVGTGVTFLAVRAIADPIKAVRGGMTRVARGDLSGEVEVYDASEVGQLQAGFNDMVAGLREHERLRDLFGRHVGEEVAGLAFERDIELGGETRDVAVLFVDLTGSTRLAETRSPDQVVELLNAFFAVVVRVVAAHAGWINKFEGDAALAIFGAPSGMDDAAGAVLGAARELGDRLREEVPEVDAGIGVSAGPVVAGYIGAEQRFEYTVIGDPVNEAARLSDLAKTYDERVLASGIVVERAREAEAGRWRFGDTVNLRGRGRATRLALPRRPDLAPDAVAVAVEAVEQDEQRDSRRFPRLPRPRVPIRRRAAHEGEPDVAG